MLSRLEFLAWAICWVMDLLILLTAELHHVFPGAVSLWHHMPNQPVVLLSHFPSEFYSCSVNVPVINFQSNVSSRTFISSSLWRKTWHFKVTFTRLSLRGQCRFWSWRTKALICSLKTEKCAEVYFCQEWVLNMGLVHFWIEILTLPKEVIFTYI